MFVIALGILIFLLFFRLLKCIALTDYKYYKIYMTVYETMFYNLFIRYILQSTLKIQVAACITLTMISWSSASGIVQGVISILLLGLLVCAPILFGIILYKNIEDLSYR